jgi:hypothetical protein
MKVYLSDNRRIEQGVSMISKSLSISRHLLAMQTLKLAVIIIIPMEGEQLLVGSGFTDFSVLDEVADKTPCEPTSRHFLVGRTYMRSAF